MVKINVQFHCLPQEIFEFAKTCAIEHKLSAVAISFFPNFKAKLVEDYNSLYEIENINRLCLCNVDPEISAKSAYDFSKKNPDCLSLTIGKYDDEGLVESILAAQTEDKTALKIWRKIVKRLNAITSEGAWVVNPNTNAKEFYKKHRFTEGAKRIADEGVKIKPIAGWNYFILGSER